ncbi:hypothetical protein D515_01696 [Grimontia indica]|uniref:Uncharacterized protein n=1 Tax=Grimontia indica TaxID=1056512 RepID=R1H081_9GAMM|nr:hypothetical protein D515_01696 [Grimontia indica]
MGDGGQCIHLCCHFHLFSTLSNYSSLSKRTRYSTRVQKNCK